ncbi:MAG: hypothetical protein OXH00_12620 [Candidatus Poribacteria bacterium]|nr:hypothetical protein [Candidatus Poribacteria bacterium]
MTQPLRAGNVIMECQLIFVLYYNAVLWWDVLVGIYKSEHPAH